MEPLRGSLRGEMEGGTSHEGTVEERRAEQNNKK